MYGRRVIAYLTVFCLVFVLLPDAHAKRYENSKPNYTNAFIVLAGGVATAGVFHIIYSMLSKQQPGTQMPSGSTTGHNLLISGDFGKRFFVAGEDVGDLTAGTPIGLSLRYQWGTGKKTISSLGLFYRTAEHVGKESAAGYVFKMSKIGFTLGGFKRSLKATWDWDFGAGIVLSEYQEQGTKESGGALMLTNIGTGLGIRISDRITVGPRVEWSDWTYLNDTFSWEWNNLISTEILLQGTFSLF